MIIKLGLATGNLASKRQIGLTSIVLPSASNCGPDTSACHAEGRAGVSAHGIPRRGWLSLIFKYYWVANSARCRVKVPTKDSLGTVFRVPSLEEERETGLSRTGNAPRENDATAPCRCLNAQFVSKVLF